MTEGVFAFHNHGLAEYMRGNIDLENDTIRVMLLNGWTPDIDTDENWDDISANEISATGYTAGGATLASPTVTEDDTNNWAKFDAVDVTWSSLAVTTITRAALVKWTGTPSTSIVVGNWLIATNSNGSDYVLRFNVYGILIFKQEA